MVGYGPSCLSMIQEAVMRSSFIHTIEVLTFPNGLEGIIEVNVGFVDSVILASELAISSIALYIGKWLPGDFYPQEIRDPLTRRVYVLDLMTGYPLRRES